MQVSEATTIAVPQEIANRRRDVPACALPKARSTLASTRGGCAAGVSATTFAEPPLGFSSPSATLGIAVPRGRVLRSDSFSRCSASCIACRYRAAIWFGCPFSPMPGIPSPGAADALLVAITVSDTGSRLSRLRHRSGHTAGIVILDSRSGIGMSE